MVKSLYDNLRNICGYFVKKSKNRFTVDEIIGYAYEGWLDAVRTFNHGMAKFRTHAFYHIRNRIYDYIRFLSHRKNWRHKTPALCKINDEIDDDKWDCVKRTWRAADLATALEIIGELPERQRRAVRLVYVQGLGATEAAKIEGKTPQHLSKLSLDGLALARLMAKRRAVA